jgi:hypothetical protein
LRTLLVWILAGIVAACGAAAPSSPAATAGKSASASQPPASAASASVGPTVAPTGPSWTARPAEALLGDSLVYVTVDRLNMRAKPTVDSKSVGVAEKGDFLLLDPYGPFMNDGYTWYRATFVAQAGEPPVFGVNLRGPLGITGWVAVAKADSPYVERLRPRCPETIDTASMQYMLGSELLACFGSNTIELSGTFGCGGCGGTMFGSYDPLWLAYPSNPYVLAVYPISDEVGDFGLRFPPEGPDAPPAGSVIRVRGHFDDPVAATCAISVHDPLHPDEESLVPISSEAAHLVCAQEFVVESLDILGTDPGFTFG